jgi:hypothetical protein
VNSEERPGDIRDVISQMLKTAQFYADVIGIDQHHPLCWKMHTACSLKRVLELLDENPEDSL